MTRTLADFVRSLAAAHGDTDAIRSSRECRWPRLTYAELSDTVDTVARGLVALGVERGDKVALLAETRVEWTVIDLAIAATGAVSVPIYPTGSAEDCEWVLSDSAATVLICEDDAQVAKVAGLRGRLPHLRHVLTFGGTPPAALDSPPSEGLDALIERGRDVDPGELERRAAAVEPDDPATIIYTSGSTGNPKGCVLTHGGWRTVLDAVGDLLPLGPGGVTYIYLPLAHGHARVTQFYTLDRGAILHYFGGDLTQIVSELAEVQPRFLPSVPRLFEKVYRGVRARLAQAPPELREQFDRAVELGRAVRCFGGVPHEDFAALDASLLAMVRGAFGGELQGALTGGAPIAPEILEFFAACGVDIYEGYGLTETTAVVSLNRPGEVRIGTVGRPVPGVEVRLADDGEVLVRGGNIMAGYHHDETATEESIVDDWFHTGDLGSLDDDGYLSIIGRKKELIIPASGKNISPAVIETHLCQSRWIEHAVLYGDRRPYPVALLTLDPDEIAAWAAERELPGDLAVLATLDEVRALVTTAVEEVNARHSRPERVRAFALLGHSLTLEGGELTPSQKVRRAVVHEKYADLFDGLYDEVPTPMGDLV